MFNCLLKSKHTSCVLLVLCILLNISIYAQNGNEVKGIVKGANGQPIAGASIVAENKKTHFSSGAQSDSIGVFRFVNLPAGGPYSFTVSYIGYETQTLSGYTIGDKSNVSVIIKLVSKTELLDQIVVVGYGTQRRKDVSTSIASIKGESIQDIAVTGIEQALAGKMAGVQITQPNGTPGAGFQIKVRGVSTITAGSSPLYVIDGVPLADDVDNATGIRVSPIANINVNDIVSIDVLKDAAAASIYGSRGSNGVVIITTKSGSIGKPVIKYEGYAGFQSTSKRIDVLDAYDYSKLVYDAHNAAYYDQLVTAKKTNLYNPDATNEERWANLRTGSINLNQPWMMPPEIQSYLNGETGLVNTDWQDAIFRTGIIQRHSLSMTGGDKAIKYFLSGNYQGEEGIVLNSDLNKMGFRTKVDMNFNKLKAGGNININRNVFSLVNSEGRYGDDGVISLALGAAPIYPIYNADGSFNYDHNNITYGQSKLNNPVAVATLIKDKMTAIQMIASGYLQYSFNKSINFRTQGSWNYNNYVRNYYRPASLANSTYRLPPSNPTATSRTKNKYTWTWENTLNYSKSFNGHSVNGLAGWTLQHYQGSSNRITATDLPMNDILNTIPSTSTATNYDSGIEEWSLASGIGRIQYNYRDRYLFSAAIRADGSSRFGMNNKWGYFPSLSLGWGVSEETFMKPVTWLTNLKLRASWGITGNMSIGNYASYGLVSGDNYVFGGVQNIGMKEYTYSNPNLGWEKTSQINIGAEVGILDIFNFTVDAYKGKTTDMLLEVPVLEISGFSTILKNMGELSNKGLEITLSHTAKIGTVTWNNNLNYSANRNKVLSLGGTSRMITQSNSVIDFITEVGKPIGNYYTYVTNGVYQNQQQIDEDIVNGIIVPNAKPGDFRFIKLGADNNINADDRMITGNYLPRFIYGYSTSVKYKLFDLSLSLQGVYGNQIANINRRYLANMEGNANQLGAARDRWISESNPGSGEVYRANRTGTGLNSVISTWHIESGSYLSIREITFGFSLPSHITSRMKINNVRAYLSSYNPFIFSKYSGYNPEVSQDDSPIMQGVDYGTYPISRNIVLGLRITL